MTYHASNVISSQQVLALITPALQSARSEADLKRRLARYGYGFRDTARGRMLVTVPQGLEVVAIPALHTLPHVP